MPVLFPRPQDRELSVERRPADLQCPAHPAQQTEEYRVLRVSGWKLVTRCPECLMVVAELDPPTPLGFSYVPLTVHLRGDEEPG